MANKKAKQAAAKKRTKSVAADTDIAASGSGNPQAHDGERMVEVVANGVNGDSSPAGTSTPTEQDAPPPLVAAEPEQEEDILKRAEKVKEQGNVSFKAGRYGEAIDFYTKAIEMNPLEPSYLTNRAASYMQLKRFRPALEDCQIATSLQSASPQPKTLLRLARCQLALGHSTPASSTIRNILSIDPLNPTALQLRDKIGILESHVRNFEAARARKDWALSRLALDKCLQAIEGEGGDVPGEWRIWRVELELGRGNWELANNAANDALRQNPSSPEILSLRGLVLFLSGKLPQAQQHVASALRLDPGYEPAQRLRKRVKDVERLKEEGNQAFKSGKFTEAVERYGEALKRVGEAEEEGKGGQIRATLLSNRATTLLKLNKHEEALQDTDASLLLFPTSFKALRTRARINLHLESYEASVNDFKAALQSPDASDADARALKAELKKAEAALKRSKTKDYYKILGLKRDCTEVEIKKAYRRESLIHHPDKGGDEERFKLVVEANAVLSDPQRRERYDMGEDEDGMMDSSGMGGGMGGVDLSELFAQFHGGGGGFGGGGFGGGGGGGGGGFRSHGHSHGF